MELVGAGKPSTEGRRLARHLMEQRGDREWNEVVVDLTGCSAVLLVSAFFNGALQEVHERAPNELEKFRQVRWQAKFAFQQQNIEMWVREFNAPAQAQEVLV